MVCALWNLDKFNNLLNLKKFNKICLFLFCALTIGIIIYDSYNSDYNMDLTLEKISYDQEKIKTKTDEIYDLIARMAYIETEKQILFFDLLYNEAIQEDLH